MQITIIIAYLKATLATKAVDVTIVNIATIAIITRGFIINKRFITIKGLI